MLAADVAELVSEDEADCFLTLLCRQRQYVGIEHDEIAAEEARRIVGEIVPVDGWPNGRGRHAYTRRFPVGPVLAITPYNAPLLLVAHKLASAFAAGNPCIVRPASKTPLSALSLGSILLEAGAPPAAVSVIPSSTEVAEALVRDERVKMLSFTGSGDVGWHLRRVAATSLVALELGGNGAVIVHEDANLAYAAERCAFGGFLRAGQACISVQRLFAHRSVFDDFTTRFVEQISSLTLGVITLTSLSLLQGRSLRFPPPRTFAHLCAASFFNIVGFSVLTPFAQMSAAQTHRRARSATPMLP